MATVRIKQISAFVLAVVAIGAAFLAGVQTGEGAPPILQSALGVSSGLNNAVTWLRDTLFGGANFGLLFAFFAGIAAAFNPCGFVMLPTYLTLYVSDASGLRGSKSSIPRQMSRGLVVSFALGLGFMALFGGAGVIFALGVEGLTQTGRTVFPWVGFSLGIVMALLGAYVLAGGKIYTGAAQQYADRIGNPDDNSLRGYFLFGFSYALASLSCTLPIFLALIVSSLAGGGFANALLQFIVYALGMTAVVTLLTIGISIFKGALIKPIRKVIPYVTPISAVLLIAVGVYLVFYWMTEGGLATIFVSAASG